MPSRSMYGYVRFGQLGGERDASPAAPFAASTMWCGLEASREVCQTSVSGNEHNTRSERAAMISEGGKDRSRGASSARRLPSGVQLDTVECAAEHEADSDAPACALGVSMRKRKCVEFAQHRTAEGRREQRRTFGGA